MEEPRDGNWWDVFLSLRLAQSRELGGCVRKGVGAGAFFFLQLVSSCWESRLGTRFTLNLIMYLMERLPRTVRVFFCYYIFYESKWINMCKKYFQSNFIKQLHYCRGKFNAILIWDQFHFAV